MSDRTNLRTKPLGTSLAWLLAAAMLGACGEDEAAKKAAGTPPPPAKVVVAEVEIQDVPIIRDFVARTEARDTIVIQARVEAILASMHFEEGRRVEKDQILYELDKRTFQAEVDAANAQLAQANADLKLANEQVSVRAAEAGLKQAKAALKKAEQDVARLRPLAEQDAVPRQDLDTALAAEEVAVAEVEAQEAQLKNARIQEEVGVLLAKAQVERAQAALILAELDLGYCTVRSPIDGLIGRTDVSVGNLVGRGEATQLATVSLIDPMWATFSISEAEYIYLQRVARASGTEGKVEVSLILADDSTYGHKGRVVTAERAVDVETGTLQLVCEFPNPDGELRPGQFGRTRMAIGQIKDAVLVPQKAVVERQGVKSILVVDGQNKVALRTVTVGERFEGKFVVEGIDADARIVVEGLQKAVPGAVVEPTTGPVSEEGEEDLNAPPDKGPEGDDGAEQSENE